jgi:repressor LexA
MARPPLSTLSPTHKRVLEAVIRREHRQLPNFVSDLVADLALKAESSLAPTLQRMARLGVLLLQGGGAKGRQRLIVSTEKGRLLAAVSDRAGGFSAPVSALRILPLLGAIPAGPLEEVIARGDSEVESVAVDELLRARPGDFLLRIKGDSMIGDGILDGDLVLLRPGIELAQGEIAAVITSGSGAECDSTLKHVHRCPPAISAGISVETHSEAEDTGGGQVILRASNPAYPDLVLAASTVRIAGVFRGLVRSAPGGVR